MTFPIPAIRLRYTCWPHCPLRRPKFKKILSQLHFGGGGKQDHSCIETYYALLSGTSLSDSAGAVSLEENS